VAKARLVGNGYDHEALEQPLIQRHELPGQPDAALTVQELPRGRNQRPPSAIFEVGCAAIGGCEWRAVSQKVGRHCLYALQQQRPWPAALSLPTKLDGPSLCSCGPEEGSGGSNAKQGTDPLRRTPYARELVLSP
jgi:hypothetical protein